jgi:hypothetical protein
MCPVPRVRACVREHAMSQQLNRAMALTRNTCRRGLVPLRWTQQARHECCGRTGSKHRPELPRYVPSRASPVAFSPARPSKGRGFRPGPRAESRPCQAPSVFCSQPGTIDPAASSLAGPRWPPSDPPKRSPSRQSPGCIPRRAGLCPPCSFSCHSMASDEPFALIGALGIRRP